MIIQEPVQATIWFTLNHYSYKDAIFLAERLNAEVASEESLYLLATCYYRAGKNVAAYSLLSNKSFKSSECRLLLARCCCDLKKYNEAEEAILGKFSCMDNHNNRSPDQGLSSDDLLQEFGRSAAFAAQMLALICNKTERYDKAIDYYQKSLKFNPFLWSSFESLIQLGAKLDPSRIFNINNVDFSLCHGNNPLVTLWNNNVRNNGVGIGGFDCSNTSLSVHGAQDGVNVSVDDTSVHFSVSDSTKLTTNVVSSGVTNAKELTQPIEIHSPFALIKPTGDAGTIDVITPQSNSWVTTCLAPQKAQPLPKVTRGGAARNIEGKLTAASKRATVSETRLSFGVFPLNDPSPLSTLNSTVNTPQTGISDTLISGSPIDIVSNGANNLSSVRSSGNQSMIPPNASITHAPAKKPQTRRSHAIHESTNRSNKPNIFCQSGNNNTQTPNDVGAFQAPPSAMTNQSSTGTGLRRSSRIFNSSSSVKENSKTTRNANQENNNNKRTSSTTRAPTKKTRRTYSATNLTSSPNIPAKERELNQMNKCDPLKPLQSRQQDISLVTSDDVKQTGLKWQRASAEGLLQLLVKLANASSCLGQFHCHDTIKILTSLSVKQLNTGWVLSAIGTAYFEMAKYEEAVKYFEEAHKVEPHRLQGTEYYSTALWHLQRDIKLSLLAQKLIEFDKNAPQTWCVAGNCFSLQKEHETAIKFLQRAIQVDPDFAYAYTLLGHELVAAEEMDHAMACFRNAIRIDARHYNAWYGIGMIYYKQEKYQLAELHYRKALQISASSPVLLCHIGVVQHALKKTESALATLNKALEMDPKNALCKFHRASIYFSMEKHQPALVELEELKQIVPKESLVYFLIGKVHKRLGNTHLALMNFSWAMDLDPKGANNPIKEVIDKHYANDDDEVVVCLDSGDEAFNSTGIVNDSSESSLRPRSHPHRGSNSSLEEDDDEHVNVGQLLDVEGI
ncbi:cell division cycle protein 27 [Brevipalpus obovatus]|uniref:cell division cycle protein 27 n=1 Tax=Brevipalpus obovatus TaxID=246614 RepID=UPI003D9E62D9